MAQQEESIDIYDAEGNYLGVAFRGEAHRQGLWHRSFHCWIVFLTAIAEKSIVFQHRGPVKMDWPNYLDISAAGHYSAGEGIEGGLRELTEELGIKATRDQLRKVGVRTIDERLYNGTINREFQDIYFLTARVELSDYVLEFPYVDGVFHLRIEDVQDLLAARRDSIVGQGVVAESNGKTATKQMIITQQDFIPNALDYLRFVIEVASDFLENEDFLPRNSLLTAAPIILPDGSRCRLERNR